MQESVFCGAVTRQQNNILLNLSDRARMISFSRSLGLKNLTAASFKYLRSWKSSNNYYVWTTGWIKTWKQQNVVRLVGWCLTELVNFAVCHLLFVNVVLMKQKCLKDRRKPVIGPLNDSGTTSDGFWQEKSNFIWTHQLRRAVVISITAPSRCYRSFYCDCEATSLNPCVAWMS